MLRYIRQPMDLAETLRTLTLQNSVTRRTPITDSVNALCSFGLTALEKLAKAVKVRRSLKMTRDNRASPSASQERSMSLEPQRHNSKLSNFMQSARYVSVPVTELQ
jgi:hypothetical protein